MMSVGKKLSIAFVWHMHQPVYQLNADEDYLMPWVRLHAVKDYLDMLLVLNDFKNLKLNFNLVPLLLDSLMEYGEKDFHDIHSRLTVTDVSELTNDDKEFILNNFFDVNYSTMVLPYDEYHKLHHKRFVSAHNDVNDFSPQEYSDIMAWFNLVWIDPVYKDKYPEIKKLIQKGKNYTLEDRVEIIEIHRQIIRSILPTYKKFLDKGRIEITTSPYYHTILPILLDAKSCQKRFSSEENPVEKLNMEEDAKFQVKAALNRMEQIFGKRPKGIWPSEHCVSPETLDLLKELGVEWAISDEGILASSLKVDFVRDFRGYLEDPYYLTKAYQYKTKNSKIKMIFRDAAFPNLIGFEYANLEPKAAASDLFDRIKVIQNKLQSSPDENHLLTIAMNGENCWENYKEDGAIFLKKLYSLIAHDDSLETVLISDYLEKEKNYKELKTIHSGSWINKNFQNWIDEPVKNQAWLYLKNVREDFCKFAKAYPNHPNINEAYKEILLTQGSDWFWWYGEPNDSGKDHVFDYLFREHLKNVYKFFDAESPEYLNNPLVSIVTKPSRYPKKAISPSINGSDEAEDEWMNAGCIDIPEGPVLHENKLFNKICYGADKHNFYLRLYLNNYGAERIQKREIIHQMYVYMRNSDKKQLQSPIRLTNKTESIFPIMKEKFHNELVISVMENKLYPAQLVKAMQGGLWAMQNINNIKMAFQKVIDVCIPFEHLDVGPGEKLEFFFANANFGIKDSFIPQDVLLNLERP